MKSKLGLMMSMGALMSVGIDDTGRVIREIEEEPKQKTSEEIEEIERMRKLKQCLSEFFYPEITIWALNHKSAEKKYRKYLDNK